MRRSLARGRWSVGVALAVALTLVTLPCRVRLDEDELPASVYAGLPIAATTGAQARRDLGIVDPYAQLRSYVTLAAEGAHVQRGPDDVALTLPWAAQPVRRSRPARRVLLDPGHHGGAWSQSEARHVVLGAEVVREGDLTYATAQVLAELLRADGYEVRLTRGPPPSRDFPDGARDDFDLEREARIWLGEQRYSLGWPAWLVAWQPLPVVWSLRSARQAMASRRPFDLHRRHDLRRRGELAASLGAEVTLSLHYNICPAGDNGVMVFVPGNYLPGELVTPGQRLTALRRVLDGSMSEAMTLARAIGLAMQREFGLPPLEAGGDAMLPNALAVDAAAGVWARNLALLRSAAGVALLVEGPCMNEPLEHAALSRRGDALPRRVVEYATAVHRALVQTYGADGEPSLVTEASATR